MVVSLEHETLKFPVHWRGSLIVAADTPAVAEQVEQIYQAMGLADGEIDRGPDSSGGKYETWRLACTVDSQPTLRALFYALEGLPGVRMLI